MKLSELIRALESHSKHGVHAIEKDGSYDPVVRVHPATGNIVVPDTNGERVTVLAKLPFLENKPLKEQG